jgi:uncharacterized membrane protein YgaE (UPF0421/DUF939 family)
LSVDEFFGQEWARILLATIIGGVIALIGGVIQAKISNEAENKRNLIKIASELAMQQHSLIVESLIKMNPPSTKFEIAPIDSYVAFYYKLLSGLDNNQPITKSVADARHLANEIIALARKAD